MAAFSRGCRAYGLLSSTLTISLRGAHAKSPMQCLYAAAAARPFSQSPFRPVSIKQEARLKIQSLKEQVKITPRSPNGRAPSLQYDNSSTHATTLQEAVASKPRNLPLKKFNPDAEYAVQTNSAYGGREASDMAILYHNLLDRKSPFLLYDIKPNPALTAAAVIFSVIAVSLGLYMGSLAFRDERILTLTGREQWVPGILTAIVVAFLGGFVLMHYLPLAYRVQSITLIPSQAANNMGKTFTARVKGRGLLPFSNKTVESPLASLRVEQAFVDAPHRVRPVTDLTQISWWRKPFVWISNTTKQVLHEELNILHPAHRPWLPLWTNEDDSRKALKWRIDVRGSALKKAEGKFLDLQDSTI